MCLKFIFFPVLYLQYVSAQIRRMFCMNTLRVCESMFFFVFFFCISWSCAVHVDDNVSVETGLPFHCFVILTHFNLKRGALHSQVIPGTDFWHTPPHIQTHIHRLIAVADKNNGIVAGLSWDRLARSVVIPGIVFNSPPLQFTALRRAPQEIGPENKEARPCVYVFVSPCACRQ